MNTNSTTPRTDALDAAEFVGDYVTLARTIERELAEKSQQFDDACEEIHNQGATIARLRDAAKKALVFIDRLTFDDRPGPGNSLCRLSHIATWHAENMRAALVQS